MAPQLHRRFYSGPDALFRQPGQKRDGNMVFPMAHKENKPDYEGHPLLSEIKRYCLTNPLVLFPCSSPLMRMPAAIEA